MKISVDVELKDLQDLITNHGLSKDNVAGLMGDLVKAETLKILEEQNNESPTNTTIEM